MAGAAPTPSGKGKKKPLDASINLVPFIDLMSCCISFLLMAISFGQLSQLKVNPNSPSNNAPDNKVVKNLTLRNLIISTSGFESILLVNGEGEPRKNNPPKKIPLKNNKHDIDALVTHLMELRASQPASPMVILPVDKALHGTVVAVLDACSNTLAPDGKPLFPDVAISAFSEEQKQKED